KDILTYYAVRLTARAKVMFSPFGDVQLRAYAAARPFGSRIGPDVDYGDFLRQAQASSCSFTNQNYECEEFIPNLPVDEGDGTGTGRGWDRYEVLNAFFDAFNRYVSGRVYSQTAAEEGYRAAMAPNPWEAGKYNIPS